jgi:hypothetical protein
MLRHVVWLWKKVGRPREEIMNRKRAGSWRDAHEYIEKFALNASASAHDAGSGITARRLQ